MDLEKEFEIRKSLHFLKIVQLYLTIKYYNEEKEKETTLNEEIQNTLAERVVNDLMSIVINGELDRMYIKADKFLHSNNLDVDEFITVS